MREAEEHEAKERKKAEAGAGTAAFRTSKSCPPFYGGDASFEGTKPSNFDTFPMYKGQLAGMSSARWFLTSHPLFRNGLAARKGLT